MNPHAKATDQNHTTNLTNTTPLWTSLPSSAKQHWVTDTWHTFLNPLIVFVLVWFLNFIYRLSNVGYERMHLFALCFFFFNWERKTFHLYMCVCVGMHTALHVCAGQRTAYRSLFSPSIMCDFGTKLRWSARFDSRQLYPQSHLVGPAFDLSIKQWWIIHFHYQTEFSLHKDKF